MDWPPQSPDLNIIAAVWEHLDREQNKRLKKKSKDELWEVLKEASYNSYIYQKITSANLRAVSPKEFKMCFVPKRSH